MQSVEVPMGTAPYHWTRWTSCGIIKRRLVSVPDYFLLTHRGRKRAAEWPGQSTRYDFVGK